MLLSIIEFLVALSILAFIHELGHYLTARLFKIEIEEFGFGLPPRALRLFTFRGTDFTFNWIPFGAFVRPKGENDPQVPGGLASAPPLARFLVLIGGPTLNLLAGIILFSILYTRIGAPDVSRVLVSGVSQESPAAVSGFLPGDIIVKINGQPVSSTENVISLVSASKGQQITITVDRDGKLNDIPTTPRAEPPAGQGPLGVTLTNPMKPISVDQAVPLAFESTGRYARELLSLPGRLIAGQISPEQSRIVGPKGMFDIFNQARERDLETTPSPDQPPAVNVLGFLAVISVALGITNLLPIPALDGGRILFLIPELLFRKRIPAQYENMVHMVGYFALLTLLVVVTAQDFINPVQLP